MVRTALLLLFTTLLLTSALGCGPPANSTKPKAAPLTIANEDDELEDRPAVFSEATDRLGLDFRYDPGPVDSYFFPAIMGGGAAMLDFDNDGDLDVYFVNGNQDYGGQTAAKPIRNRLFEQTDSGVFKDVTQKSGLGDTGYGMGVAVADVNNDGFTDVYVTNYGADQLFVNQGDGTFQNATESAGIDNLRWAASATFVDYDRDGWLDLYVTNYVNFFPSRKCKGRDGRFDFCSPSAFPGTVDKLYRNLGGQSKGEVRFEDATVASGIASQRGPGLGVTAGDFNADGWPDLYVANDGAANFLWINQKDGSFEDEAVYRGAALDRQGRAQAGMGIATADLNRDGRSDLFITHLGGESNALYLSTVDDFDEDSVRCGLGVSSFSPTGFGVAFVDFEHDGDEDVLIANGRVTRSPGASVDPDSIWNVYAEPNQYLISEGDCRFKAVKSTADEFLQPAEVSRALCVGDIDNDGDMDVLVVNLAGKARLYLNEAKKMGHWLIVKACETDQLGQRDAYGAVVRLQSANNQPADAATRSAPMRTVNPGSSYCASNDARVHFGLGEDDEIQGLEVTWVDGRREWFAVGAVDRQIKVIRGKGTARE